MVSEWNLEKCARFQAGRRSGKTCAQRRTARDRRVPILRFSKYSEVPGAPMRCPDVGQPGAGFSWFQQSLKPQMD